MKVRASVRRGKKEYNAGLLRAAHISVSGWGSPSDVNPNLEVRWPNFASPLKSPRQLMHILAVACRPAVRFSSRVCLFAFIPFNASSLL